MVRVLRLLEYIYDDDVTAEGDMAHWGVPGQGQIRRGHIVIRSAILPSTSTFAQVDEAFADEVGE